MPELARAQGGGPMNNFVICGNPKCHFVFDPRINGKSSNGPRLALKSCPACGGAWSSACPSCGQELAMKLVGGLPYSTCCDGRQAKTRAA